MINNIKKWFDAVDGGREIGNNEISAQIGCLIEEISEFMESIARGAPVVQTLKRRADEFKQKDVSCVKTIEMIRESEKRSVDTLDALADIIVTCVGVASRMGFDIEGALNEVNESNFSKFENGEPVFDENGKVAKGRGYFKPSLKRFIERKMENK